jgi:hypothetical protein
MHDRPANEVTMDKNSARLSGRALASADTFRRSLAWTSLSHLIRAALPAVAPYLASLWHPIRAALPAVAPYLASLWHPIRAALPAVAPYIASLSPPIRRRSRR